MTYAARAETRARVGYLAQQVLNAISVLVNVHGAGSFAESNRMQQYGATPTPRRGMRGFSPLWATRSMANRYWGSRSESAPLSERQGKTL